MAQKSVRPWRGWVVSQRLRSGARSGGVIRSVPLIDSHFSGVYDPLDPLTGVCGIRVSPLWGTPCWEELGKRRYDQNPIYSPRGLYYYRPMWLSAFLDEIAVPVARTISRG